MLKYFFTVCMAMLPAAAFALPAVSVMADRSLTVPLTLIAREYSRTQETVVAVSFALSSAEIARIAEGESADVLITVRTDWIDTLRVQGLVDIYSRISLARNRLALAGAADSTLSLRFADGFDVKALGEKKLVIGNPELLPEGVAAMDALGRMGVLEALDPKLIYESQTRRLLDMAAGGEAYAIAYYTDAADHPALRVIDLIPETSHAPIEYQAAVLAGEHMNASRQFVEYLRSEPARQMLRKYGFTLLE